MDGVARVRVSRITRRAPCRADNVVISAYGFHGSTCVCHICSRDVDEGLGVSEEDRTREEENSGRSSISTPSYFLHLHPFIRTRDFQRDFQRRSILNLEAGKQVERSFTHRGKPLFPEKRSPLLFERNPAGNSNHLLFFFRSLNDENVSLRARTFSPARTD